MIDEDRIREIIREELRNLVISGSIHAVTDVQLDLKLGYRTEEVAEEIDSERIWSEAYRY